ncbi:MAG: PKD domain-containing protein [Flavobacteriales bacterium]|nr:PKD domain-containing protein [Flavobacteriales bacterium]
MRSFCSLSALLLCSTSFAQVDAPFHCGAGELHRIGVAASQPDFTARAEQSDSELENFTREFLLNTERGGGSYVIPIVFHIIHNNGVENIGDAQIHDAVRILNEDFNRENPDWDNVRSEFLDIVADIGVEFRLAAKDPNGNCTNGITRTVSSLTNEGSSQMKSLISWPRNKYLQVWVAASADGAAGYTFRPGTAQWMPEEDGVVMQHMYTGSIGTSSVGRSRALTHEVGHWLNLAHTWGNSNDPGLAQNCSDDDGVDDTPNTIGWTSCTLSGASCGSALDNVENYMEYSYCSKMYTEGQKDRMIAALNSSTAQRSQLWQLSNLINTGVNGNGALCAAQFSVNTQQICAGSTVQFTDESYHNITSRSWSFPGGTPATSTDANPTVTYDESGTFPVTLTVSNGSSSLSNTTNGLMVVSANPGAATPITEGFEAATQLTDIGWTVTNANGDNTFAVFGPTAFSGSKCIRVTNTASMDGRLDGLLLPTIDMSGASDISVSFRYAYARRISTNDDRLRVFVSNDCGLTWSLRKQLFGSSTLSTAPVTTSAFVPSDAGQWGFTEITSINETYHVSDFRMRFEFESDGGNNLYIDDININGSPVGLEENMLGAGTSLMVVPNPVTDATQAVVYMPANGKALLDLVDVVGRSVMQLHSGILPVGPQRVAVPVAGLPSGLYFVRLQREGFSEAVRFVVP